MTDKSSLQTRLEEQLRDKGIEQYEGMARSILEDRGHLVPGSFELTEEGKVRDELGDEGRALDRDGNREGRVYNPETNRVTRGD